MLAEFMVVMGVILGSVARLFK